MIGTIRGWFNRYFSDPEVVILAIMLLSGIGFIVYLGGMLAPVLASIVLAFLLEGVVRILRRSWLPRMPAVLIVFALFMASLLLVLFGLLPLLSRQLTELIGELPTMIAKGQYLLMQLPERYPNFISSEQISELLSGIRSELAGLGQRVLSYSLSSLVGLLTLLVYLVLMPLLVFFFLKDKRRILDWISGYLPSRGGLSARVWADVETQIVNYVRGKFIEVLVVWVVTYAVFAYLDLSYAMTLSLAVGLSVIIPYIGAVVITLPIALIAFFQWGWSNEFFYLMVSYGVIQALDGNLLVPLLFSEVVNLHPIAIIVAVLFFGGIWGFWGVFFAIPLATLVQAVLTAWPRAGEADAGVAAEADAGVAAD